jgi:Fe-S-cluster containining protein
MLDSYKEIIQKAKGNKKSIKKYLNRLKTKKVKKLDEQVHELHTEVFEELDCLQCANCCKTTGPLFTDRDISRISKHLGLKAADFEEQYLRVDEDQDWVLKSTPCTFLGSDNYCSIYEVRPKACAAYPHTDHVGFQNILDITEKNTRMCPAAAKVVEKMMERIPV